MESVFPVVSKLTKIKKNQWRENREIKCGGTYENNDYELINDLRNEIKSYCSVDSIAQPFIDLNALRDQLNIHHIKFTLS